MTSDVVRLICPNLSCRTVLSVPASARGRVVRCRKCQERVKVPPAKSSTELPSNPAAAPAKPA